MIDLSLYYDLFFASISFLCGGILLFQGWRLDPILLLCQILSNGTAIFFIGETILLRSGKSSISNKTLSFYPNRKRKNEVIQKNELQQNKIIYKQLKFNTLNPNLNNNMLLYTTPIEYFK